MQTESGRAESQFQIWQRSPGLGTSGAMNKINRSSYYLFGKEKGEQNINHIV